MRFYYRVEGTGGLSDVGSFEQRFKGGGRVRLWDVGGRAFKQREL